MVRPIGDPNLELGVAMRKSQADEMLIPPPTAQPRPPRWSMAGILSIDPMNDIDLVLVIDARPAHLTKSAKLEMSVPEMNALPPVPRKTTTRTLGSLASCTQMSCRSTHI